VTRAPGDAAGAGDAAELVAPARPKVRVRGLRKSFEGQVVLAGVDLDIPQGDNLVLLGASGSGKTVLMKCLIGLIEPDAGSVEVDGVETIGMTNAVREQLMRHVGVLFQNGALFDSLPVWENVGFGLLNNGEPRDATRKAAVAGLADVGLGPDVADLYPAELSGGMQKRVGLARAIARGPDLLLLDNPTAGLDPIVTAMIDRLILGSLERLNATALTITHDIASARRLADRIALLDGGRIEWEGPVGELDWSGNPRLERFLRGTRETPAAPGDG
jgi:phospholipid/cholesterol/gamma-HCH transport system ATP-binding protein